MFATRNKNRTIKQNKMIKGDERKRLFINIYYVSLCIPVYVFNFLKKKKRERNNYFFTRNAQKRCNFNKYGFNHFWTNQSRLL